VCVPEAQITAGLLTLNLCYLFTPFLEKKEQSKMIYKYKMVHVHVRLIIHIPYDS